MAARLGIGIRSDEHRAPVMGSGMGMLFCPCLSSNGATDSGFADGTVERLCAIGVAQLHTPGLGRRQRRLRPLTDHLPLMFGNRRQQVQGQPVGMGQVAGNKVHTTVHEVGDEGDVAGQPVQLGNDQRCPMQAT